MALGRIREVLDVDDSSRKGATQSATNNPRNPIRRNEWAAFSFFFRSAGRHNVFGTCGGTRAPVFGTPNRRNSKTKHQIKNNNNNKRNGILPDRFPLPTSSKTKSAGTREKRIQIWFDEKKIKNRFLSFHLFDFRCPSKKIGAFILSAIGHTAQPISGRETNWAVVVPKWDTRPLHKTNGKLKKNRQNKKKDEYLLPYLMWMTRKTMPSISTTQPTTM